MRASKAISSLERREMRLGVSPDTPFVVSPPYIGTSRRSFKLDLPFCFDRLLNLPLILRLSRFFNSFFPSFRFLRFASSSCFFYSSSSSSTPSSSFISRSPLFVVAPFLYTYLPVSQPFAGSFRPREICADRFRTVSYLVGSCFGVKSSRGVCFFLLAFSTRTSPILTCRHQEQSRLCIAISRSLKYTIKIYYKFYFTYI